jgi:DNA-directed RNA polymerase specialized sigma24 family protein
MSERQAQIVELIENTTMSYEEIAKEIGQGATKVNMYSTTM